MRIQNSFRLVSREMNSALLKTEALCYLRFNRGMDYVCTEAGYWSADVIGADENTVIEIEVKVSRADLLAEFRNKKSKHAYYQQLTNWSPNYFYFLVPIELAPEACEIVKEKFPKAGVLTYKYPTLRPGERLKVVRNPQKLHGNKPFPKFVRSIRRRASSELCGLHIALDDLRNGKTPITIEQIESIKNRIIDSLVQALGVAEWEHDDRDNASIS